MPIAISTYYEHKALQPDTDRDPERVKRVRWLEVEIQRVWDENLQVYGAKKVCRQLKREDIAHLIILKSDSTIRLELAYIAGTCATGGANVQVC